MLIACSTNMTKCICLNLLKVLQLKTVERMIPFMIISSIGFLFFPCAIFFTISLPLQVTAYVLVISYICHVKDLFVANLYKVPTLYYLIWRIFRYEIDNRMIVSNDCFDSFDRLVLVQIDYIIEKVWHILQRRVTYMTRAQSTSFVCTRNFIKILSFLKYLEYNKSLVTGYT